jgi:hypothetical protein
MVGDNEIEPRRGGSDDGHRFRPWTPLERSIFPSLVVTAVVLLALLVGVRVRLPPLPYSLVIVFLIWLACYIGVYIWQVQRRR